MKRLNAMTESFDDVEVFGKHMIFTCMRIDPKTVPAGLYMYEVADDDSNGEPCEVRKWVLVNHWGTLLSREPIELTPNEYSGNDYRGVEDGDFKYLGTSTTVEKYLGA